MKTAACSRPPSLIPAGPDKLRISPGFGFCKEVQEFAAEDGAHDFDRQEELLTAVSPEAAVHESAARHCHVDVGMEGLVGAQVVDSCPIVLSSRQDCSFRDDLMPKVSTCVNDIQRTPARKRINSAVCRRVNRNSAWRRRRTPPRMASYRRAFAIKNLPARSFHGFRASKLRGRRLLRRSLPGRQHRQLNPSMPAQTAS